MEHIRAYKVAEATGIYAFDLTKAGLLAPIAFWYKLANRCHNLPLYSVWSTEVRRHEEIIKFRSGFRYAGKNSC
jgi:hypothetical protein